MKLEEINSRMPIYIEMPIEVKTLKHMEYKLAVWIGQKKRWNGIFQKLQRGIVEGNIMAYETMIEALKREIALKESCSKD